MSEAETKLTCRVTPNKVRESHLIMQCMRKTSRGILHTPSLSSSLVPDILTTSSPARLVMRPDFLLNPVNCIVLPSMLSMTEPTKPAARPAMVIGICVRCVLRSWWRMDQINQHPVRTQRHETPLRCERRPARGRHQSGNVEDSADEQTATEARRQP